MAVILLTAIMIPGTAHTASISDASQRLDANEAKARQVQRQLDRMAGRYQDAYHEFVDTRAEVRQTQRKIKKTQIKLKARQKLLAQRANYMYRHGKISIVDVLLGANDFTELVTRVDLFTRIANFDSELITEIKDSRAKLGRDKAFLKKRLKHQVVRVNELSGARSELDSLLARQKSENNELLSELKKLKASDKVRRMRTLRGTYVSNTDVSDNLVFKRGGYTFPVAGSHDYASTFGAPRRGHTHQGNDIFGPRGTPLVAVTSGSVRKRDGGIGGLAVWLNGSDGNCYYYAHLDGFAASGSVSAGTVIGYLGDTGNAKGTSPHVHFEIHPGCGRAVDPYSILRSWE